MSKIDRCMVSSPYSQSASSGKSGFANRSFARLPESSRTFRNLVRGHKRLATDVIPDQDTEYEEIEMDQNLTQKTVEAINQASELALENSHQQLTTIHLAIVLLEDPEGLAQQAVLKHGNEDTLR